MQRECWDTGHSGRGSIRTSATGMGEVSSCVRSDWAIVSQKSGLRIHWGRWTKEQESGQGISEPEKGMRGGVTCE